MTHIKQVINRRQTIGLGAAAAALSISACTETAATNPSIKVKDLVLDFEDNIWNREAYAKLSGHTDPKKQKFGWFKGKAFGVKPKQKNLELCGFEGFSVTRLLRNEDGSYRKLLREVGFYGDTIDIVSDHICLLYTSPSPRDGLLSRMPSSA